MVLWEAKSTENGSYTTMKTPSKFNLSGEDLDKKAYRSIETGSLIRNNILGKKWKSAKLTYKYLTEAEAEAITAVLDYYPMYVRFKSPHQQTSGFWEGQCYCNKWEIEMERNHDNGSEWANLQFTLVQGKRKDNQ